MRGFLIVAGLVVASANAANSADLRARGASYSAPLTGSVYNWTGLYVGAFVGGSWADVGIASQFGTSQSVSTSGAIGGFYAGYDYELPNRFVVGARFSVPLASTSRSTTITAAFGPPAPGSGEFRWAAALNSIVGYDMGPWMPYVGAGVAFLDNKMTLTEVATESDTQLHTGLNLLVGIKYMIARGWAVGMQYNHTEFSGQTYAFPRNTGNAMVKVSQDSFVGTLDYRF
jgi:opacity protein-like surface antigen